MKRPRLHLIVGACVLATAGVSVAADTLPARLSDEEFWQLLVELSEPMPSSLVFSGFVSNDITYQRVIPALKQTARPDGVYLGVGPEQNFTYIAALQPKIAFIIDPRHQNIVEQLLYKALFEVAADRADFVSRLFSRPRPVGLTAAFTVDDLFRAITASAPRPQLFDETFAAVRRSLLEMHHLALTVSDLQALQTMLAAFRDDGPLVNWTTGNRAPAHDADKTYAALMTASDGNGVQWSYLATDENFRRVQELERRNLVVPLLGDFGGPKALRAVGAYVRQHGAVVGVFHTSSVEEYLKIRQGYVVPPYLTYCANVATLPVDAASTFIRSSAGNAPRTVLASMAEFIRTIRTMPAAQPPAGRGAQPPAPAQISCH